MLESLKELIFGLNEFEKAKIDDRINQAFLLVPKIKLNRLEDFEILEENIYKLKEQLRIKSSNLNRVIKASKLISKKQVLQFIKDLENIRYAFLKKVFTQFTPNTNQEQIKQTHKEQTQKTQTKLIESTQEKKEDKKEQEETKIEKILDKEILSETKTESNKKNEIHLIEEKQFTLLLNNGIIPYLTIKFKDKLDLIILKNLSSLFFEISQMHGTNIIVENNTALIIPRFQNDNLINLPQIQENLDEIYQLLKNTQNSKISIDNSKPKSITDIEDIKHIKDIQTLKDIDKNQVIKNTNQEQIQTDKEYIQINDNFKKQEFKTKKYDEDSLDALLTKHQEETKPKDEPNITKPDNTTKEEIKFEPIENKIEFEKKESEINLANVPSDNGVEVSSSLKSESEIEIIRDEKQNSKKDDLLEKHQEIAKQQQQQYQFEIYRDENIVVYFKEDSKASGTLCLTTPSGQPIHTLSENELSYLTIFSKVFAGVLFEVVGCQGTNIIWNFSENTINIIPRLQDDNIIKMWDLNQEKPETLEKIKEQLLTTVLMEQEKNKPKTPQVQNEKPKQAVEEIQGESNSEKEKRVKHLLNSLRRIPK
jgi:hypothetical protein